MLSAVGGSAHKSSPHKSPKAGLRSTDYGKDPDVTLGIRYEIPGHFAPKDGDLGFGEKRLFQGLLVYIVAQ